MKKWKYLFPVATIAFGLWACGDDSSSSAECLTEECLEEYLSELGLDSLGESGGLPSSDSGEFPTSSAVENSVVSSSDFLQDPLLASSSSLLDVLSASSSSESVNGPADASSSSNVVIPQSSSSAVIPALQSSSSVQEPLVFVSSSSEEQATSSDDFKEDYRDECKIGTIPSTYSNAKLPDPFTMLDGTKVTTKEQWKCRREELAALLESVELGEKPRNPEKVEGSYSGGKLTVKVTDQGKSISFSVSITGAGTKDKPVPAIIGYGGGSLGSSYSGLGVASISFAPDDMAPESSRGSGNFYTLYGSSHSAGALIAWAWGVSRVIDALMVTPEAGIDVHHLGVTGCSRWGKGALVAGAFDARIALVIPQESGSGGASNWRSAAKDSEAQPLSSACTEAPWFRSSFCNYKNNINGLATDHHFLTGMVAPHGLLVLDNTGWVWLGEGASYANAKSTLEIFKALGAEKDFTYSKAANHMHCSFPSENTDEVQAFVKKYLLDDSSQSTGKIEATGVSYNASDWQDWVTPTLN